MANYASHLSTKRTPQSEPIPGSNQVANSAGGFSFAVSDWDRLDRFLVLGCEGGSYYASENKMTKENAGSIINCANEDAQRTVNRICEISEQGRAPKNDPAIFAMALLSNHEKAKSLVFANLNRVCRIGTHLFQYVEMVREFRGWGKGLTKAIQRWYTSKSPRDLAYQMVKYQSRGNWSHRNLMDLCHVKLEAPRTVVGKNAKDKPTYSYGETDNPKAVLARWAKRGELNLPALRHDSLINDLESVWAFEKAKKATTEQEIVELITKHRLVRECIPTQFLNSAAVWDALLEGMPITAMTRNLGKMTKCGLIAPLSDASKIVRQRITDVDRLKKGRIHPLTLLVALKTYAQGHGEKGKNTWTPVQTVVDALDEAFYLAFNAIEPTGKNWLLALDVSGSMATSKINDLSLSAREASGAMALVTAATEQDHHIIGFTGRGHRIAATSQMRHIGHRGDSGVEPLTLSKHMRLDAVTKYLGDFPFGPTDCALPMLYALEQNIKADVFVVYTDNETWQGNIHAVQALRQYREKMGIPAKLIVCGMISNGFTIADPSDAGMLDVVGFDTATPQIMSEFAK